MSFQSRVLKFGVFEVDLEAGELRKSGMRQKLAGQPFEVLRLLLERPQEIVTREQLRERIWPQNTFVDYDLALGKAINRIREVLGDSAESPRFIETIPRRGYRFIAPVSENGNASVHVDSPPSTRQSSRRGVPLAILFGLGTATLFGALLGFVPADPWHRFFGKPVVPQIRSIAVLPLRNLSADPEQEYFSDGMTDALITDLAQISSVRVISGTSTMRYKKTDKSLPEIARELNVDGIVEGTVQRSGDRVRITAQLIYGPSDKHLWAESYERDMRDAFALERDLTDEIARRIQARVTAQRQAQLRPVNPKVLEAYFQGNYHMWKQLRGSTDEKKKAAEYFQQAIDADPNFAPAYNGLAQAHADLMIESSEDIKINERAVEKAIQLDPSYSEARVTLGSLKWQPFLDWRGAEDELKQAIALDSNNADAHEAICGLLDALGRVDEALPECQIAQQLDPNNVRTWLPCALAYRHDYDGSIETAQLMLQRDPDAADLHGCLVVAYTKKRLYKEAIAEYENEGRALGFPQEAARIHRAFNTSGYQGALRQLINEIERLQASHQAFLPGNLAELYTTLGDKDHAFYWLEQAYEHREMAGRDIGVFYLKGDPMLDPLRSDPRFKALLDRAGLPP